MQRQHSTLFLLSQNSTEMAVKVALLAALCFAQAFATEPETFGLGLIASLSEKDYKIFTSCVGQQQGNFLTIKENIAKVPEIIMDIDKENKDAIEETLKRVEQPVNMMSVALMDTHSAMFTNLKRMDFVKAYQSLLEGMATINGLIEGIRKDLNQVKAEKPELTSAIEWYMRTLLYQFEVMYPKFRKSFGACLFRGVPSLWE